MKPSEKKISEAVNMLIRAMSDRLCGSVTFHFNQGKMDNGQMISHFKLGLDDNAAEG